MTAARLPLITLTTDFGLSDTYVGVVKGVILGIAPHTRLIDLTHDIEPQNILEAGARLEAAVPFFPPGTIHLVVVDPGVGSDRPVVLVRTEQSIYVAPDNGVLTLPLCKQPAVEVITLTEAARPYLRHPVSATFHGRDIFAPLAAHVASGLPITLFGIATSPDSLVAIALPTAEHTVTSDGIEVAIPILYADRFGNLVTALRTADLVDIAGAARLRAPVDSAIEFHVGSAHWRGIVRTFASVPANAPLAYWGSSGRLEIGIRNGSARRQFGVAPGEAILLRWSHSSDK